MGVYIDIEMPTGCGALTLQVWPDGQVEIIDADGELKTSKAVPVPHHGRLIDADAAAKQGWVISRTYSASPTTTAYEVKAMTDEVLPTIIPAEEGET